jgi:hypothetical protein
MIWFKLLGAVDDPVRQYWDIETPEIFSKIHFPRNKRPSKMSNDVIGQKRPGPQRDRVSDGLIVEGWKDGIKGHLPPGRLRSPPHRIGQLVAGVGRSRQPGPPMIADPR